MLYLCFVETREFTYRRDPRLSKSQNRYPLRILPPLRTPREIENAFPEIFTRTRWHASPREADTISIRIMFDDLAFSLHDALCVAILPISKVMRPFYEL